MTAAERAEAARAARAADRAPWWDELRDPGGAPVDPIVWAPWARLLREAQFGVELDGRWMVHMPSMSLVTWPGHRALRSAMLKRYGVALRRFNQAQTASDELAQRRALRAMERPQAVLGILRAVEVLAALMPHRVAVQVPSFEPGRAADWRLARLVGGAVPASPDR